MRSTLSIMVCALAFAAATNAQSAGSSVDSQPVATKASAPPVLTGRFSSEGGLRTLSLWGTPQERGFAHGYLLAKAIMRNLNADLPVLLGGSRKSMYENTLLKMVIPRFGFSDDEHAEMGGIVAGIKARLPIAERQLSLFKREVNVRDIEAMNTAGDWMALGCSSLALSGKHSPDGKPLVGRNFDFPAFRMVLDDQHVMVVKPAPGSKAKGFVGVSHPGCIGVITGMNDAGVFAAVHDVHVNIPMLRTQRANVPRLCAIRRLVEQTSADGAVSSALSQAKTWPTLYGNNIMMVTPKLDEQGRFAGVLEYDHRRGKEKGAQLRQSNVAADDWESFLICTNHYRVRDSKPGAASESCSRYKRLRSEAALSSDSPVLSVKQVFEMISTAAAPKDWQVQRRYRFGTTHQVVAYTGSRSFHVKMGEVGKNIREVKSHRIMVDAALAAIPGAALTQSTKPLKTRPKPAAPVDPRGK